MKILVLYQDIDSGSKIATEAILACLQQHNSSHEYVIYKQNPSRFSGKFSFFRNLCWSIADFRRVINSNPDIDLVYTVMYTSAVSFWLSFKKVPQVFHLHGDQSFEKKVFSFTDLPHFFYSSVLGNIVSYLQCFAITHADHTFFVSKQARQSFLSSYGLEKFSKKTSIVPNGVSRKSFHPVSQPVKNKLQKKYVGSTGEVVLYVGRMDQKKGVHLLINALRFIPQPQLQLIIAYPDYNDSYSAQYYHQLKQLAKRTKPHRIVFIKNPGALPELYQLASCVVLPSKQEMMPLVMLEALASGVPFISYPVGGIPEVMSKVSSKLLLNDLSEQEIARSIQSVLSLPKTHKTKLALKGLQLAEQLTWEKSSQLILKQFKLLYRHHVATDV